VLDQQPQQEIKVFAGTKPLVVPKASHKFGVDHRLEIGEAWRSDKRNGIESPEAFKAKQRVSSERAVLIHDE
jgi:hypothetical protein